jgi:sphingolipid C9-methyltransferase
MSVPHSVNGSESEFEFIETPKAPTPTFEKFEECGVRTTSVSLQLSVLPQISTGERSSLHITLGIVCRATLTPMQYPSIKNAPLPADGPGNESFSYLFALSILGGVPLWLSWKVGGGTKTALLIGLITTVPLLAGYWMVISTVGARLNEKARFPGRPIEHYLTFKKPADKAKYHGKNKIAMETFHEMYFDGDVDFNGDALEVMEYRHDWANFRLTVSVLKYFLFGMIPEAIRHSKSQGKLHTTSAKPESNLN